MADEQKVEVPAKFEKLVGEIEKMSIVELASIPPRNELLGRLVGSIYSPVSSFVRVLNKISEKSRS